MKYLYTIPVGGVFRVSSPSTTAAMSLILAELRLGEPRGDLFATLMSAFKFR
jgi:hypothetical protein